MAIAMHSEESFAQRLREGREELRELGSEAGEIASGAGRIARDEVRLAVAEVKDGVRATVRTTIWGGVALGFGIVMLMWLPLPIYLGLNEALESWIAALITVAILAVLTAIFGFLAYRQMRQITLVPKEAIARMKEDTQWVKQQLSRNPG